MGTTKDYASDLTEVKATAEKLQRLLSNQFGWKIIRVIENHAALFDRFCPFREGDRVVLTKTPDIKEGSGWLGSKHFLIEGAAATIKSRDFYKGKFVFLLEFDDDSWIDLQGNMHPTEPTRRYLFEFSEDWITLNRLDECI